MTPAQSRPEAALARPTLRDVARALGVSIATISNAYNRPDQLSAELRQRILDTARELGYVGPNPLARSLRRGKTGVIALVYDAPLDYAFADPAASLFLGSLAATIQTQGLNLLLLSCHEGTQAIQTASVDGFILYSDPQEADILPGVLSRQRPTVLVEQPGPPILPQVQIDNISGAAQAARHLAELGHTHIGVLSLSLGTPYQDGPLTPQQEQTVPNHTTAQRLRGYRQGAPHAHLHILATQTNSPEEGETRTRQLLQTHPEITALLCMSDVLAQGAMNAVRTLGMVIPTDLSLIGFDDLPSSAALNLTSVWQPISEKGQRAGQAILIALAGEPGEVVTLPTRLVVRGSTAKMRDERG